MRVVCLQHVPYETPDAVALWATARGHDMKIVTPIFERYPDVDDFDLLVVMGGPMGAYEDAAFPWLVAEKAFISRAIEAGKLVFGICLGAQLTACALGGSAHPHTIREVGWFPVRLTPFGAASRVLSLVPDGMAVGLWHGDTYDLPAGVVTGAVTEACANQAFETRDGRVVGLQFHLEWSAETLQALADRHGDWFDDGGPYVQSREEFLNPGDALAGGHAVLFEMLDAMEGLR
jgi:GMP synthase-like glutamine amidotransferase